MVENGLKCKHANKASATMSLALLPGILWKYHVLYNELPDADSWIWRHYPDGERWREAIEEMGFPQALNERKSANRKL